jgi:hypothetical protein
MPTCPRNTWHSPPRLSAAGCATWLRRNPGSTLVNESATNKSNPGFRSDTQRSDLYKRNGDLPKSLRQHMQRARDCEAVTQHSGIHKLFVFRLGIALLSQTHKHKHIHISYTTLTPITSITNYYQTPTPTNQSTWVNQAASKTPTCPTRLAHPRATVNLKATTKTPSTTNTPRSSTSASSTSVISTCARRRRRRARRTVSLPRLLERVRQTV